MSTLRDAFNKAAGDGEAAVLMSPGSSGLCVLFSSIRMAVNVEDIESIHAEVPLPVDYSFTWDELRSLATRLGWQEEIDPTELDATEEEESHAAGACVDTISERAERHEFSVARPRELSASVFF